MGLGRRGLLLAAALAFGFAHGPSAGAGAPPPVRWAPSIEAGLKEAKSRGVPLMVALNMDRERGNEAMVEKVYTDPLFVAAAAKCVCTIGSLSSHAEAKDPVSGRMVCSKFGSLTCMEHQEVEGIVRTKWLKKGPKDDVDSPQHFFLAPDGRRLFSRTWTLDARELASLMARAGDLCAPESLAAWDTLEGRLKRAGDPLRAVRAEALKALAAMKDAAVDAKLIDMAKGSSDEDVRSDVADAFAPAMNPARTALAAALLDAKAPETRMHAAVALEAAHTPEALQALGGAVGREKEVEVRGVLFRAVSGCSPTDASAKSLVLAGLKERSPLVLPHVIVALAPWAEDPQVVGSLKPLPSSKDPWPVRAAACWTLGLSKHKELADAFQGIRDEGRRSRLSSVAKLAARQLTEGVDPAEYRHALRDFAPSRVRHPGDPEE